MILKTNNTRQKAHGPVHTYTAAAKSHQSCLTLCDPIDGDSPGCPWNSPGKNTGVGCHFHLQCIKVKSESEVTQLCPTLRDTMDCSLPASSVHGTSQARVLEWVAIAFSNIHTHIHTNQKLPETVLILTTWDACQHLLSHLF